MNSLSRSHAARAGWGGLAPLMVCVVLAWWSPPAEGNSSNKEEVKAALGRAQARLASAQRAREKAAADVARFEAALPGAFNAYRAAQDERVIAKTYESDIIHRLRREIEEDPRKAMVRSSLTDAENAERNRRNLVMPAISASKEHESLAGTVGDRERNLREVKDTVPLDRYELYKSSHRLLIARDALNRYIADQLSRDTQYREIKRALDGAVDAFNDLEREISTRIASDPERRAASIKAGKALIAHLSRRLAFDDIWNGLNDARSRLRRAERAIAREQAEVRYLQNELRRWDRGTGGRKGGRRR